MTYELPYGIGSAFTSKAITRRLAGSIQCRWLRTPAAFSHLPLIQTYSIHTRMISNFEKKKEGVKNGWVNATGHPGAC